MIDIKMIMPDKGIIGIKIPKNTSLVVALKIIRKYTHESYAIIKSHILNYEYIFSCEHADDDGLNNVISLYGELNKAKIKPILYEHGNKTTIHLLKNLAESYKETNRQIDYIRDQESEDSEFETYEEFLSHYEDV